MTRGGIAPHNEVDLHEGKSGALPIGLLVGLARSGFEYCQRVVLDLPIAVAVNGKATAADDSPIGHRLIGRYVAARGYGGDRGGDHMMVRGDRGPLPNIRMCASRGVREGDIIRRKEGRRRSGAPSRGGQGRQTP